MAKTNTIAGLDVGSSRVRAVVASCKEGEDKLKIIGLGEANSGGVRKGVVVDIEEVNESVKKAVEQAELSSGVQFNHAYISIGGNHIGIRENNGLIAVSRADSEVSEEDISRVLDFASTVSLPANREIIHVIPRDFKLDNEKNIQNPLGMTGTKLESYVLIVDGLSPYIRNLMKCVSGLGIKIDGLVLNVLAVSQAVLSKRQKELGVLVLDLGGGTTGMAVYEEGKLLHVHVLPVGSSHITNDIAIGLRTTIDMAEKIKLQHGLALPSEVRKKEIINLSDFDENETETVSRREVAKIIEARIQEIFDLVNKELKKIGRTKLLPAGVVLTGGGALMPGIVNLARREFGLPAEIGFPSQIDSIIEKGNSPDFATAVGLVLWAAWMKKNNSRTPTFLSEIPSTSITISKIKKWLRAFLP